LIFPHASGNHGNPEEVARRVPAGRRAVSCMARGETADEPRFVDAPIGDPEKLEAYCRMAEGRGREGVVLDGNRIIEILPWD